MRHRISSTSDMMKRFFKTCTMSSFAAGAMVGVLMTSIAGAAFRGSSIFRDVPSTHYADEAIGEMYQLGIIKGLDSTHFGPDDPLTRGQAALLFKRLRDELKGSVAVSSSKSSSVSSTSSSSSSSSVPVVSCASSSSYNAGGYVRFDSKEYNVEKAVATGKITIIIVRIGGNQGSGTVDYDFTTGSAVADKDFKPKSGTITFTGKQTNAKVELEIINNTSDIANRTVNLMLKKPTGSLKLGCPETVLLHINDPRAGSSSSAAGTASSAPSAATMMGLSATAYAVSENGSTVTITVNRTGVATGVNAVNYSTADGLAKSGSDYTAASGTLTFAANETTKSFTVSVADNSNIEGSRSFSVNLSGQTNAAGLSVSSATVTIDDNEAVTFGTGSLKFSSSTYTLTEGSGEAKITINHVAGYGPVSVHYSTSNGSALAGSDYTSASGTMSFAQGEVSKIFVVPVFKDSLSEERETVNLTLSGPTNGATLMDPSTATIEIND